MTELRMLKKMNQGERTSALEAVIAGNLNLFIRLMPKRGLSVVPTDVLYPADGNVFERSQLEEYRYYQGFFKFIDGKKAAYNVLIGENCIKTLLLDEDGTIVDYVHFVYQKGFEGILGADIHLDNDLLAVDDFPGEEKVNQYLIPTPEFAAVMDIWEKYWSEDNGNVKAAAIVRELQEQGFPEVRAKAIEMICRPEKYRTGGRIKN